jgi:ribose 5-phosphate isomerase RpiB
MIIAVINETAAGDKNSDILAALEGSDHTIINAGMRRSGEQPELQYYHTGLMTALLLNLKRADFVIGSCGTGQGFFNAAVQYPGVFCGHILTPLDAWLFYQINGGNCISLALNQGYGWAGGVNLRMIFDALFSVEKGAGYPEHRREAQRESREILSEISQASHLPFAQILSNLSSRVVQPVLNYPGMRELMDVDTLEEGELKHTLKKLLEGERVSL